MKKLLTLFLLLTASPAWAAISPLMVWEIRTTGSDTACSGGFRGGSYIAAPSAPTVNGSGTGGTVAANTYYVVITYTDALGDTVISGQTTVTVSGATSSIVVTSPSSATGALTWNCYFATTTAGPYFPQGTALVIGANRSVTTTPPTSGTQPRGVDRTLQNGAQVTVENSAITATTAGANSNVITFTGYTPTGADVGNTFHSTAGTNITVGTYEITGVTSTTWTVTGAANLTGAGGAGSAITGVMGGAVATPGQGLAFAVTTNLIYVKAGTYTLLNGTVNTAGNKIQIGTMSLVGYSTNRYPGNTDTQPVFDAGAASMTMFATTSTGFLIDNFSFTNSAARASITALFINSGALGLSRNISISACAFPIGGSGSSNNYYRVYMTGCGAVTQNGSSQHWIQCVSASCTSVPWTCGNSWLLQDCIAISPTSGGYAITGGSTLIGCICDSSSGALQTGFTITSNYNQLINCISRNNTGKGFALSSGVTSSTLFNCAAGANVTADYDTNFASYQKINCVTLTATPFTNSASLNFSLNTTVGGGAACRAAGIPGTFPGLSTTGYRDIGAVQHADPAAGGFRPKPRPMSFDKSITSKKKRAA